MVLNGQDQLCRRFLKSALEEIGFGDMALTLAALALSRVGLI
jgi:hypothetical protein